MGRDDKIKHAAEEAVGKVKEATRKATDNDKLEAEGRGDQTRADGKRAGDIPHPTGDVRSHRHPVSELIDIAKLPTLVAAPGVDPSAVRLVLGPGV